MIMDYLPCPCKIPFKIVCWHNFFNCYPISKMFAAHFKTKLWLNIGKKIFYCIIYKLKKKSRNMHSHGCVSAHLIFSIYPTIFLGFNIDVFGAETSSHTRVDHHVDRVVLVGFKFLENYTGILGNLILPF